MPYSRRRFVGWLAAGTGALAGCGSSSLFDPPGGGSARFTARPGTPTGSVDPGLNRLGLDAGRDGLLYVPASYVPGTPAPFLLALHGAGITAEGPINLMSPYAESHGFLLLSVDSSGVTWDAITFKYSYDVTFIDSALRRSFERCSVNPARVVVSGFSDGASYALGLGLANGDLFSRVVAFSPGGIVPSDTPPNGHPEFFLSHGVQDPVLPIDLASRRIAQGLRGDGYSVELVEFNGGHTVPPQIALQAVEWFLRP
jgi:phospholipase/carboxylesterase